MIFALILAAILPHNESLMCRMVAMEYGLNNESTVLLMAIRAHENGRPGLEFGIGGPMNSGHPAHRYQDGVQSFMVQARWAAGTIKKRYDGDLLKFARRYCPKGAWAWYRNVSSLMWRIKNDVR